MGLHKKTDENGLKVLTVSPQKTGADYVKMELEKESSSPADKDLDEDNVISPISLNSDVDHVRPVSPGCMFPERPAESPRIMQEELAQVSPLGNAAGFTDEMNIGPVSDSTQKSDENGLKILAVSPQKTGADYTQMELEKENTSPADEDLDEDNVISTTSLNPDVDHVLSRSPGCKFPEKPVESLHIMQEDLAQVSSLGNTAGFNDEMNIESVFESTQKSDENGLKVQTASPQKIAFDDMKIKPKKKTRRFQMKIGSSEMLCPQLP